MMFSYQVMDLYIIQGLFHVGIYEPVFLVLRVWLLLVSEWQVTK